MAQLTTRERFVRTLTGQDTDRVPFMKIFGGTNDVLPAWERDYPGLHTYIDELLGLGAANPSCRTMLNLSKDVTNQEQGITRIAKVKHSSA